MNSSSQRMVSAEASNVEYFPMNLIYWVKRPKPRNRPFKCNRKHRFGGLAVVVPTIPEYAGDSQGSIEKLIAVRVIPSGINTGSI